MKQVILIIIFSFVLYSCEIKQKNENEMNFDVNQELLGEESDFSDFTINSPKGWNKLSNEQSGAINKLIDKNMRLESAFINEELKSFMFISLFSLNSEDNLQSYMSQIQEDNINYKIVESRFFYNGIDIIQFMVMNDKNINIKLICSFSEHRYLVDYIVSYDIYEKNIKKIESSIGSIRKKGGKL